MTPKHVNLDNCTVGRDCADCEAEWYNEFLDSVDDLYEQHERQVNRQMQT